MQHESNPISNSPLAILINEEDARVCDPLHSSVAPSSPLATLLLFIIRFFHRTADQLASGQLIFPWLLSGLGAPLYLIGLCVPLREVGQIMPQLFYAGYIRGQAQRKWILALIQCAGAICLMFASFYLVLDTRDQTKWFVLLFIIALLAMLRGLTTMALSDIKSKILHSKWHTPLIVGPAALSGIVCMLAGLYLVSLQATVHSLNVLFALLFGVSALLWLMGSISSLLLAEPAGSTSGAGHTLDLAKDSFLDCFKDVEFRQSLLVRTLLLGTTLSVPVLVNIAERLIDLPQLLGLMLLTAALGKVTAGYFWAYLGKLESRRIIAIAAGLHSAVLTIGVYILHESHSASTLLWTILLCFYLIIVSYTGERLGRRMHSNQAKNEHVYKTRLAVGTLMIGIMMFAVSLALTWIAQDRAINLLYLYAICSAVGCLMATSLKPAPTKALIS